MRTCVCLWSLWGWNDRQREAQTSHFLETCHYTTESRNHPKISRSLRPWAPGKSRHSPSLWWNPDFQSGAAAHRREPTGHIGPRSWCFFRGPWRVKTSQAIHCQAAPEGGGAGGCGLWESPGLALLADRWQPISMYPGGPQLSRPHGSTQSQIFPRDPGRWWLTQQRNDKFQKRQASPCCSFKTLFILSKFPTNSPTIKTQCLRDKHFKGTGRDEEKQALRPQDTDVSCFTSKMQTNKP